jgi:DNA-binding MarR family transcriptional regulator
MALADDDPGVIPALLRAARGAYGDAIREELAADGIDDLPRNGAVVLGGMANHGASPGDLIRELRVSKQAASQLIDSLVLRGFLERHIDATDRRRLTVELTPRGQAAAAAVRRGVVAVDEELGRRLAAGELAGLRAGLVALADIAGSRA